MVWLIGNRGMLGSTVEQLLEHSRNEYFVSDKEVDITRPDELERFIHDKQEPPNWIINCAAYTAVDRAEDEPAQAARLNSIGPKNLACLAAKIGASLIHVSTDYVFDGERKSGYSEDDPPGPRSVYGRTKYAGEAAVASHCSTFYIVRTAWLFSEHGNNFVKTMLARFRDGAVLHVIDDQWGSPTYAGDLAAGLCSIATSGVPIPCGIYHFSNTGVTSWYEFAREIYALACNLGLCEAGSAILPVNSSQYHTRAERPAYSVLQTEKIAAALHIEIPDYKDALRRCLLMLKEDNQDI